MDSWQARNHRPDDEQTRQAEEHVRTHDASAIQGQRHQQRYLEGSLLDDLARRRWDMDHGSVVGQAVEDQQAPRDANPASYRAFARLRGRQQFSSAAGAECGHGRVHQLMNLQETVDSALIHPAPG